MCKKCLSALLVFILCSSLYGQKVIFKIPKDFKRNVDYVQLENSLKQKDKIFNFNDNDLVIFFTENEDEFIGIQKSKKELSCKTLKFNIFDDKIKNVKNDYILTPEELTLYSDEMNRPPKNPRVKDKNTSNSITKQKGENKVLYVPPGSLGYFTTPFVPTSEMGNGGSLLKTTGTNTPSDEHTLAEIIKFTANEIVGERYPTTFVFGQYSTKSSLLDALDNLSNIFIGISGHGNPNSSFCLLEDNNPIFASELKNWNLENKIIFLLSCYQFTDAWQKIILQDDGGRTFIGGNTIIPMLPGGYLFRDWWQQVISGITPMSILNSLDGNYGLSDIMQIAGDIGPIGIGYFANLNSKNSKIDNSNSEIKLSNHPNPFNPSTLINYRLPENSFVKLKIYNSLGQEIETLINEQQQTGNYSVKWSPQNITSGIYFYKLQTEKNIEIKKMMFVK